MKCNNILIEWFFIHKNILKKKVLHMDHYTQLKEAERVGIYKGLKAGLGVSMIADTIGRDKSTVSREIRRNRDQIGYLYPRDAQQRTNMRKARHRSKISRNQAMKTYILEKLQLGWSPGVIAGRWNREHRKNRVCAETIYAYIYRPENKDLQLWKLLAKTKKRRGQCRKQHAKTTITHRVSIDQRPKEIDQRKTMGHFEGDLMFTKGSQSENILTLVERKSRMVFLGKNASKKSDIVIAKIQQKIGDIAHSLTLDNGTEFALHHMLGIKTYFCNPGSPWQKGSVENMNGLLRRYIPFSMPPEHITQEMLDQVEYTYNMRPRKILNFLTPFEVFMNEMNKQESRVKPALPAAEVP